MSAEDSLPSKKRKINESSILPNATSAAGMEDSDSDDGVPEGLNASSTLAGENGVSAYETYQYKKAPVRPREKRSEVWNYFDVQEMNANGQMIKVGKCKNCPFYGKYSSSTSFMKDHLKKCKGISYTPSFVNEPSSSSKRRTMNGDEIAKAGGMDGDEGTFLFFRFLFLSFFIFLILGEAGTETPKARRTSRPSFANTPSTKPPGDLQWNELWECLKDNRRAKYPKALNALCEDLGVFQGDDLKSLDYEQFDLLASLLKPVPQKGFYDLLQ
jgi:hypothetical protein